MAAATATPPQPKASALFDESDANILIRSEFTRTSSNGRSFRVRLERLATSSVFADMAEVGNDSGSSQTEGTNGLPETFLSEPEDIIEWILQFLYNGLYGFPEFAKIPL